MAKKQPKPTDIDTLPVKDVDGWLAPNGDFYYTGWQGHTDMARWLVESGFGVNADDIPEAARGSESLLRAGWLGIGHIHVFADYSNLQATEAQILFVKKLLGYETFDHYQNVLKRFLERVEWYGNKHEFRRIT